VPRYFLASVKKGPVIAVAIGVVLLLALLFQLRSDRGLSREQQVHETAKESPKPEGHPGASDNATRPRQTGRLDPETGRFLPPTGGFVPPWEGKIEKRAPKMEQAGEPGFVLTPEALARVEQQNPLAASHLGGFREQLSSGVSAFPFEGNTNANPGIPDYHQQVPSNDPAEYHYSYKAWITGTQGQAMLEYVFDQPDGLWRPPPMRVAVDEFGNVYTTILSLEEAERLANQP
jgi:hypothetical protein